MGLGDDQTLVLPVGRLLPHRNACVLTGSVLNCLTMLPTDLAGQVSASGVLNLS
jgi:hypothetical protein